LTIGICYFNLRKPFNVNADSNKVANGKAFKTNGGKTVYGGGGIMPDFFIPADTTMGLRALGALYQNNTISNYTYLYFTTHTALVNSYPNATAFAKGFTWSYQDWKNFLVFASRDSISLAGLPPNDKKYLSQRMKGLLARYKWRNEGYFQVLNPNDEVVIKALKLIQP